MKVKTEKVNKLFANARTSGITEVNELIYAEAKQICDKIGIPRRNPNRNTKPDSEIRLEGQINKLRQRAKMLSQKKKKQVCNGITHTHTHTHTN